MTGFFDLDYLAAGHLATAIARHRDFAARSCLRLPDSLGELEEICLRRVREGQEGSPVADLRELLDSQVMTPRLLSYADAAKVLACSLSTVKRVVSAGDLVPVYIAGSPRLRVDDIDAYIDRLNPAPVPDQEAS